MTDATNHRSTAEIVLSNLDPQPYPISVFGAPCPPPLQEYKNVFTSVVPDCQGLENFTQLSESKDAPELANQDAGDIDSTTSVIMDASESSSIEITLSSCDDTPISGSADVCDDASVLKQCECMEINFISLKIRLLFQQMYQNISNADQDLLDYTILHLQ